MANQRTGDLCITGSLGTQLARLNHDIATTRGGALATMQSNRGSRLMVGVFESVPHVVQKRENFWTISRLSYGSGRFYKALWAANKHLVPVIDELYVGTTILIPPPEALDPSLIILSGERMRYDYLYAAETLDERRPGSKLCNQCASRNVDAGFDSLR